MSPPGKSPLAGGPGEREKQDEELFARLLARHPNVNLMSPADLREVLREWMAFQKVNEPRLVKLTGPGSRRLRVNAHHISSIIHSNESDRHQSLTAVQILGEEKPWLVLESEDEVSNAVQNIKC